LPDYKKCLEIFIYFSIETKLGGVRFWNYNASTLESVKGVKEIEVIFNDKHIWNGMLQRGEGNDNTDYSTLVIVQKGTRFPPVILKPKVKEYEKEQEPIQEEDEMIEEQYDFDTHSVKNEPRSYLDRVKDDTKKEKTSSIKETSKSSMPIWFTGSKRKGETSDDSNKDTSGSETKLPDIGKSNTNLTRRQAAALKAKKSTQSEAISEIKSVKSRRHGKEGPD
jgi:hypothetical protein